MIAKCQKPFHNSIQEHNMYIVLHIPSTTHNKDLQAPSWGDDVKSPIFREGIRMIIYFIVVRRSKGKVGPLAFC
jgi:hypothetical protein